MKLKRLVSLTILLVLLTTPLVAIASDIREARFYGIIRVSNNGTATENVATTCNISTQNLIDGDYLNASANNCAIRTSSGGDVVFQPSVNSTYFWSIFEESIGANSYDTDILYTANSTGGLIAYFPGAAGMETADNDTFLELGDNFTIEQSGWIDTDSGGAKDLIYKPGAFNVFVSDIISENITAAALGTRSINLLPNAPGTYCNLPIQAGNACPNHWTNVDEAEGAPNDGDWNGHNQVAYAIDSYNVDNVTATVNSTARINTVTVHFRVSASGVDDVTARPGVILGADNTTGTPVVHGLGVAWTNYTEELARPGGGEWLWSDLNDSEVFIDLKIEGIHQAYCSQIFLKIAYEEREPQVTATNVASGNHTVKVTGELTLDFDGTDDYIQIPDASQLDGHVEMSLEMWGRVDGAGSGPTSWLISKEGIGAVDSYRLWVNTTTRLFACLWEGDIGWGVHTTTDNYTLGEWFYLVSTYDGANIKMYLNGVYDGATPLVGGAVKAQTADVWLGIYFNATDEELNGSMVEAKIYSRALTAAEITQRANGYYADETGLVAHYPINEGTGTNIVDSTAYGHGGTAHNTSWDDEELKLYIDNIFCDIDVLTTVPNTSANWTACENGSFMWLDSQKIDIGGVERQHIEWEYAEVFTDLSGNGNDATPSFRIASSDADVSAELLSFYPVAEAKAPAAVLEEPTDFISAPYLTGNLAVSPGDFTITPDTSGGFPLAGAIAAIAGATATPAQLPLVTIAMFIVLVASLCTGYYLRKYGRGSLLVKMLITAGFMGIFVAIGNFGIDMWMIYFYLGIAIAMGFGSKAISI